MRFLNQIIGLLLLLGMASAASDAQDVAQDSAQQEVSADSEKAVKAWLALVDEGKVDESLEATSSYFKERVDAKNWQEAMTLNHDPLGDLISRELTSSRTATDLPGGPEGEYTVFKFTADYDNKKQAVESITMLLEDEQWRVIGYYIE